jgi:hypothetical protein
VLVGHEPARIHIPGQNPVQRCRAGKRTGAIQVSVQYVQRTEPEHQGFNIADHVLHVILAKRHQPKTRIYELPRRNYLAT